MFKQLDLFASVEEKEIPAIPKQESLSSVAIAEEAYAIEENENQNVVEEPVEILPIEEVTETAFEEQDAIPVEVAEEAAVEISLTKELISTIATQKTGRDLTIQKGKRGRKSLKEMDGESEMISIPDDDILFKKQYYSIGEVSAMFNLNTSLLRYWETEFDILKPRKNRKGDRHFRPEDIKNLHLIHHLLRQRKYTIEGAKDYLKKNKSKAQQNFELIQRLEKLKSFLFELKAGL